MASMPQSDPMISNSTKKVLGRLTMCVFMPALIGVSLASNLSWSLMADGAWILPVWGCIHMLINLCCGLIVRGSLQIPEWFRLEFLLAFISTNSLGLPLIVFEPLCRTSPIMSIRYGLDGKIQPFDRLTSFLFIYNLPWIFYLLGGCHFLLARKLSDDQASGKILITQGLLNPSMTHDSAKASHGVFGC